jgi:hypothetical protein
VEPFTVIIGAGDGDVVPAGALWDTVKLVIVIVMNLSTPGPQLQSKGRPLFG